MTSSRTTIQEFLKRLEQNRIPVLKIHLEKDESLTGITENSKEVREGFVFVAFRGTKVDSHEFIEEAVKRGASLIIGEPEKEKLLRKSKNYIAIPATRLFLSSIASAFYRNPSRKLRVVGITGTNGKTTTTYLLKRVFRNCALLGTVRYILPNDEEVKVENHLTTPPATLIQKFLWESIQVNSRRQVLPIFTSKPFAVVEVSSHALATHRVDGIDFSATVFTNLTRDHLDFHKTMEEYRRAKLKLFEMTHPNAPSIINADDENFPSFWHAKKGRKYSYGFSEYANYKIKWFSSSWSGTEFILEVKLPGRKARTFEVKSRLSGKHNVYNLTAAFATAHSMGVSAEAIREALKEAHGAPGRMEKVVARSGKVIAVIDYAHTPDAMENILKALKDLPHSFLITVFGAGGNRDKGKRPLMAEAAQKYSDFVIVTSDNPRFEDPLAIIEDIKSGFEKDFLKSRTKIEPDRKKAIELAIKVAKEFKEKTDSAKNKPAVIAILGKGHEDYQEIEGKKHHFSDIEITQKYIEEL